MTMKHSFPKSIGLSLISLFSVVTLLANNNPVPKNGYWIAYIGDNKITKKVGLHSEIQVRNLMLDNNVETFLFRTGTNIYLNDQMMLTAGYGYFNNTPSTPEMPAAKTLEHRTWQQFLTRHKMSKFQMEHRYRLEQRFVHHAANGKQAAQHRMRYRFQTLFPVYQLQEQFSHVFLALNNELMINLRPEPTMIYDRNRFFAGMGVQLNPKMNVQMGYLNQYANLPKYSKGQVDHCFNVIWIYNTDFIMRGIQKKKAE
jgi:hypothetical protein